MVGSIAVSKLEKAAMYVYEKHRTPHTAMPPWQELPRWYKHQFICDVWLIARMVRECACERNRQKKTKE